MTSPPIELRILGPTGLTGSTGESGGATLMQPKRLALLAWLALETAAGFRRRDQIVGLFWPDLDQEGARTQLRKALFALREALGSEAVLSRGESEVRLDPDRVWCDAAALSRAIRDSHWAEALRLYRGDLLEGLYPEGVGQEFEEWLAHQRKSLRDQAAHAAWECCRFEEERGDRKAAAVMARRALSLDPDNEEIVRRLMALLDRHGDRGGALRVYADWQVRMQAEYGVEPAPETRKLARKIQAARKGESHETPPIQSLPAIQVSAPAGVVTEPSPRATLRWPWIVGAALALVVVAALLLRPPQNPVPTHARSVAVLPLRLIGNPGAAREAQAIEEELATFMIGDTALTVRSASRAREATSSGGDVDQIGRRLGVAYVVDGGVQVSAGGLRLTLRLIRTADGIAQWAGSYDLDAEFDHAAIAEIAGEVAAVIRTRLGGGEGTGHGNRK